MKDSGAPGCRGIWEDPAPSHCHLCPGCSGTTWSPELKIPRNYEMAGCLLTCRVPIINTGPGRRSLTLAFMHESASERSCGTSSSFLPELHAQGARPFLLRTMSGQCKVVVSGGNGKKQHYCLSGNIPSEGALQTEFKERSLRIGMLFDRTLPWLFRHVKNRQHCMADELRVFWMFRANKRR